MLLILLYLILARKNLENFKASAVLFITIEFIKVTDIVLSSTEPDISKNDSTIMSFGF
jgi:hypothetical protein